jgi:hypothetical protein
VMLERRRCVGGRGTPRRQEPEDLHSEAGRGAGEESAVLRCEPACECERATGDCVAGGMGASGGLLNWFKRKRGREKRGSG